MRRTAFRFRLAAREDDEPVALEPGAVPAEASEAPEPGAPAQAVAS